MTENELNKILQRARIGDSLAEFEMGMYYDDGLKDEKSNILIKKDKKRAIQWYKKAAHHGNVDAMVSYAIFLSDGLGIKKNPKEAIKWLKFAVKKGLSYASINIAIIYIEQKNYRRAFFWFYRAVEMGDGDACFDLAWCYCKGIGVQKNFEQCKNYLHCAIKTINTSEYGRQMAMILIGILYYNGFGVSLSFEKAKRWFEKANGIDENEPIISTVLHNLKQKKSISIEISKPVWDKDIIR